MHLVSPYVDPSLTQFFRHDPKSVFVRDQTTGTRIWKLSGYDQACDQDAGDPPNFYFIADYHALTSIREPESLKEHSYDLTATRILGMDLEDMLFSANQTSRKLQNWPGSWPAWQARADGTPMHSKMHSPKGRM